MHENPSMLQMHYSSAVIAYSAKRPAYNQLSTISDVFVDNVVGLIRVNMYISVS